MNEEAKRNVESPTVDLHSIYDDETKLRIHLQLKGIFSYFKMMKLTINEIKK